MSHNAAMNECPFCGGDRNKDTTGPEKALRLRGLRRVDRNPGGITFEMEDGKRLHVIGECNACDERDIYRFLIAE